MRLFIPILLMSFLFSSTSCSLVNSAKEKLDSEAKTEEPAKKETVKKEKKPVKKKVSSSSKKPYIRVKAKKNVINSGETHVAQIFVKNFNKNTGRRPKVYVNGLKCIYDGTGNFAYSTIQSPTPGQKNWKGYATVPLTSSRDTTIHFNVRYEVR